MHINGYQRVKVRKFGQCIHMTGCFFCFRSKQNIEYKGKIGVDNNCNEMIKTVVYNVCLIK